MWRKKGREMQPPHHHSRIDLAELKTQIVKKLGAEGSKQYFYYLNRFLSLKLSKVEFNKFCVRIFGWDNIRLHNQLICSILRNACSAKIPPSTRHDDEALKLGPEVSRNDLSGDAYQQNGLPGLSNGAPVLSISPQKGRMGFLGQSTVDNHGARELNGRTSFAPQPSAATQSSDFNGILENGDLHMPDIGFPVLHSEDESRKMFLHTGKMLTVKVSANGSFPLCSKDQTESVVRVDGKGASARNSVQAPLGVPFCPVSIGGMQRALPPASCSKFTGTLDDLSDSVSIREQMEQLAVAQGLEGVSVDSANILKRGLNVYLKGLIGICIELVGARSGHGLTEDNTHKHHNYVKLINGVRPSDQHQMQDSGRPMEVHGQKSQCLIPPFQDFKVAMELNQQKLGEDWPILLEKICTRAFEE